MTVEEIRNYVQRRTPDFSLLAELVEKAKGKDRTMAQFALQTGLSAPTLSRVVNGKLAKPMSIESIIRIYENRESEEDQYLLDAMARANGMFPPDDPSEGSVRDAIRVRHVEELNRAIQMRNAIIGSLFSSRHRMCFDTHPTDWGRNLPDGFWIRRADLHIKMKEVGRERGYDFWNFYFCPRISDDLNTRELSNVTPESRYARSLFDRFSSLFLMDAWYPDAFEGVKTSFVFLDQRIMNEFKFILRGATLNSEVSLILIDPKTYQVSDEVWVGNPYNRVVTKYFEDPLPLAFRDNEKIEDGIDDIPDSGLLTSQYMEGD